MPFIGRVAVATVAVGAVLTAVVVGVMIEAGREIDLAWESLWGDQAPPS